MRHRNVTIVIDVNRSLSTVRELLFRLFHDFEPESVWQAMLSAQSDYGHNDSLDGRSREVGIRLDRCWHGHEFTRESGLYLGLLQVYGRQVRFSNELTSESLILMSAKTESARVPKRHAALTTRSDRLLLLLPRLRQMKRLLVSVDGERLREMSGEEVCRDIFTEREKSEGHPYSDALEMPRTSAGDAYCGL